MNIPVILVNEDDSQKAGAIYVGALGEGYKGKIQIAIEDAHHFDEASAIIKKKDAIKLALQLIAMAWEPTEDTQKGSDR